MSGSTTIQVDEQTKQRLDELKPFPSVSYEDLIADMADVYATTAAGKTHARAQQAPDSATEEAAESPESEAGIKTVPQGGAE